MKLHAFAAAGLYEADEDRQLNDTEPEIAWPLSAGAPDFLAGAGEMGRLIGAFDWASTALGPIGGWPQSLKTLTGFLLRSPVPMVLLWGPDGVMIYNDSYSVFAGGRHPLGLGRPVLDGWPEVAEFNANVMKVVLAGGTLAYKDQELTLYREGRPEQVWMNLDYSPVLDEDGRPAGVIAIVVETTEQVLATRRIAAEQDRQRQLFNQMPGFIAVTTGPAHVYEYVNAAYQRIAERTEFIGRSVREALPDLAGQGFYELLDHVYASGETVTLRATELRLRGAGESKFIDFVYDPIRDDAGAVTGIFIGGYEVTETQRALAALSASEEQLRLATENAEVGLWDVDVVTDTLYWPPRVKAMFGISAGVPVSMADFYTGLHPEDRERISRAYIDAADPVLRGLYDVEYRTVGAEDKVVRWVAAKGRGVFDGAGNCVRMIGTAQDVTARKHTELRLQELNATLEQQVVERARERALTWQVTPDLLAVCNARGMFESVNPAWTKVLGWSEQELLSDPFIAFLHPDDVAPSQRAFQEARRGKPLIHFENRYRTRNGAFRWMSWVAVMSGERVFATARDVTEEKAQAAALAARTAERELIWRNAQDLLVVLDPEGKLLDVSFAANLILGWPPEEMVGRSVFDFIHPDDLEPSLGALREASVGALPSFVNRYRHRDGSYRWLSWVAAPENNLIYATARHVTVEREQAAALAEAQEALRQAQKMEAIGQLTGGIAHDFNNLLAGISGSLELLEARLAKGRPEGAERYIGAAQGSARRAAALTQRLLAFSRRQTLDPKPTDVNRLVTGMDELIRRTVGPAVLLEVVGAAGLWMTMIDPSQLENSLLNLCINARDAMPAGGRITIETGNKWLDERAARDRELPPGQYIQLSVSDSGTGMAPNVIAQAFEPFFTTKPLGQGTGLGLSMVHGFVRQSGGQVRIYSELGKGTTMSLYLPRFIGEAEQDEAAAEELPVEGGQGETVLVVDDEATVRMLMAEVLEEAGYAVLEAADGPEALKILQTEARVDLLLTDVGLPGGMNGRQVADAARATRPDLKVLFVTGYAENAVIGHGHLSPGMAVITKPFQMTALGNKVREIIET